MKRKDGRNVDRSLSSQSQTSTIPSAPSIYYTQSPLALYTHSFYIVWGKSSFADVVVVAGEFKFRTFSSLSLSLARPFVTSVYFYIFPPVSYF